ncbi:MAG: TolC family outer membrane protein [Litoreibacter sp.]|uniref:TolC family outer membrane protein n=1 Tax=Litoreibacter sp. TaxID=1969459 RepID=UPI00329A5ACC
MSRRFLNSAILGLTLSFSPLLASAETLTSALTAAYNNSNLLEQSRALLRAQDEGVAIALSALRPQVNGSASLTQNHTSSVGDTLTATVGLTAEVLLWDAGRSKLSVESAKEAVLAVRSQLVQQEQAVLLQAVNAYVQVLRDQRVLEVRQSNLRLITQELRAARDRFEVGEVTRTDVAQAEARLAFGRGELADAQGQLEITRELYKIAVGRTPSKLESISDLPRLPANLVAAKTTARQMSPEIEQIQHEIKANELSYASTKARTRPSLSATSGVSHSDFGGTSDSASIGLSLNVPIYQGGQLSALVRQALAQVHASKAQLNQQVLSVEQGVGNSWAQLAVARAQVASTERQISAAQTAFDGVREEAKLGARTTLDALDAEQDLSDARTNFVVAQTQVYSAAYSVLASMGLLTADNLKLNVERYDPSDYYKAASGAPVPTSKAGKKLDRILQRYQKN